MVLGPKKHPADDLAAALARLNGMMTMLSGVYDSNTGTFVTGLPFVHESVQAAEVLVTQATEALTVLYQTCDMSVVRDIPAKRAPSATPAKTEAPKTEAPKFEVQRAEASRMEAQAAAPVLPPVSFTSSQPAALHPMAFSMPSSETAPQPLPSSSALPPLMSGSDRATGLKVQTDTARAFEDAARMAAEAKAYAAASAEGKPFISAPTPSKPSVTDVLAQARNPVEEFLQAKAAVAASGLAAQTKADSYMGSFGPEEQPSRLVQRVEKTLGAGTTPPAPAAYVPPTPPPVTVPALEPDVAEKRAQSYEELLRKITMVSAQAHSEGNAASIDGALLPLVETIRRDLAKIRSVA